MKIKKLRCFVRALHIRSQDSLHWTFPCVVYVLLDHIFYLTSQQISYYLRGCQMLNVNPQKLRKQNEQKNYNNICVCQWDESGKVETSFISGKHRPSISEKNNSCELLFLQQTAFSSSMLPETRAWRSNVLNTTNTDGDYKINTKSQKRISIYFFLF